MASRIPLVDSTINSMYDYILNGSRMLIIPLIRCDHIINRPFDIVIKQEYIPTADDYNDNPLQIGTRCESRKNVKINETEIKIKTDYIDGCTFESIVSRSYSNNSSDKNTLTSMFCCKTFTDKFSIRRYMRICSRKPTFTCDMCKQSFHKKLLLITHILNHTKEKSKKCSICNKMFTRKSHLKIHMSIHSGQKPFKCKICHKSFSQTSNLKVHTRTHTSENFLNAKYVIKYLLTQ